MAVLRNFLRLTVYITSIVYMCGIYVCLKMQNATARNLFKKKVSVVLYQ